MQMSDKYVLENSTCITLRSEYALLCPSTDSFEKVEKAQKEERRKRTKSNEKDGILALKAVMPFTQYL